LDFALFWTYRYSEVPNRRGDWNKQAGLEKSATLFAYLLSKLINDEQSGIYIYYIKNCKQGGKKI
jgi:hypothetical protein